VDAGEHSTVLGGCWTTFWADTGRHFGRMLDDVQVVLCVMRERGPESLLALTLRCFGGGFGLLVGTWCDVELVLEIGWLLLQAKVVHNN
jgi:hypothetical protein